MTTIVQPQQSLVTSTSSSVQNIQLRPQATAANKNNQAARATTSTASLLSQIINPSPRPTVLLTTLPALGRITPFVTTTNGGLVIGSAPELPFQYVPLGQTIINANNRFYDGSGIGENPIAQYDTAKEMRYKFLDTWLFDDYSNIVSKLIIKDGVVRVASPTEEKNNDINKNSEKELEAISDFIGDEILTTSKTIKLLKRIIVKNGIKFYDIPHNEKYVKKSIARYVVKKLNEMQK